MTSFSVCLPNCKEGKTQPPGVVSVAWLRELATSAEALGYDGLWVSELLQSQGGAGAGGNVDLAGGTRAQVNYFDPISTLGYVAAVTDRVRLTTATIVLPHHHPVVLGRQIATLDAFTGGRITLGVGLGGSAASFKALRGDLEKVHRGTMMDEYLEALRLQWEHASTSYDGRYVRLTDAEAYPKPVQQPLPIYVAGSGEAALRRVARFGQGWIDSHTPATEIGAVAEQLAALRAELGLEPQPPAIARQVYMALADTRERAQRFMSEGIGGAEPQATVTDPEQRRIVGTPDDFVEQLRPFAAAGVSEICSIFYGATLDSLLLQLESFARDVLPRLTQVPATP
jgi:probable F420-dependent oxidoreductase